MHGPRGATSGWNLGEGETQVYKACTQGGSRWPLHYHAPAQLPALPQLSGQDPSGSFPQGWAGTGEGGPPNLPCQQLAFLSSESMGEGLAAACFSSSSPSLSSPAFPPLTSPSWYQPCSSSLPVVLASLPALPCGSQPSSVEQGREQGREGKTVTRCSCLLLLAALRVAPETSSTDWDGQGWPHGGTEGTGRMEGTSGMEDTGVRLGCQHTLPRGHLL